MSPISPRKQNLTTFEPIPVESSNRVQNQAAAAACQKAIDNLVTARRTGQHLILNKQRKSATKLLGFQCPTTANHTMAGSLPKFIDQKLPTDFLKQAIDKGQKIEVIECNPEIFIKNIKNFGYESVSKLSFNHNKAIKPYNYGRPAYFTAVSMDGIESIVVATIAGEDYHKHYTSLIRNFISSNGFNEANSLKTICCPDLRNQLYDFKGLDNRLVKKGDSVVIGYVGDIERLIAEKAAAHPLSSYYDKDSGFGSHRFKMPDGRAMNLLGSRDSFWGEMAGRLADQILKLGADEIIYAAKLGCTTNKSDVYSKTFSPTKFYKVDHVNVTKEINDVRNPIADFFPKLNSGAHASVPTVLEEMHDQRAIFSSLNVNSVDNEISHIADAVSKHNSNNKLSIGFSPVHFATDYLRSRSEADMNVDFDLSNNRSAEAVAGKGQKIRDISSILENYFSSKLMTEAGLELTQADITQAYADYMIIRQEDSKLQRIQNELSSQIYDLVGLETCNNGSFGLLLNHSISDIDLAIGVPESDRERVIQLLTTIGGESVVRQSTKDSFRNVFCFEKDGVEIDLGVLPLRDYKWTVDGMNSCRNGMALAERVVHVWTKRKLYAEGRYSEYAIYKLSPYKKYFNENFIFNPIKNA